MSVSAETYIVISLMFAVFAAVAAVGTSVVLGAGFERLRAGFELIKGQTGFFADAIYKLDIRTQKLDEETAKLKSGVHGVYDRMDRVEKQTTFVADAVNSIEQRILQGTPAEPAAPVRHDGALYADGMNPVHTVHYHAPVAQQAEAPRPQTIAEQHADFMSLHNPVQEQEEMDVVDDGREALLTGMFRDNESDMLRDDVPMEARETGASIGTLLSRYFQSENDKGIIYH